MQGIVFNGHYMTYFDVAFTEYWRATGLPDAVAQAKDGVELFARKAQIEYLAPARFDDVLDIGVRCERIGVSSLQFILAIFRDDQLLVQGELVYVYANGNERKPVSVPDPWRATISNMQNFGSKTI